MQDGGDRRGIPAAGIAYVRGDLLAAPAQTLVNPVNGAGVMGAGLALAFRRRYPAMHAAYREACRRGELRPGGFHLFRAPDRWIYNFPTKRHWRERALLTDIEAGLATFVAVHRELGIASAAFPRLGCGLGGLDWEREVRAELRMKGGTRSWHMATITAAPVATGSFRMAGSTPRPRRSSAPGAP